MGCLGRKYPHYVKSFENVVFRSKICYLGQKIRKYDVCVENTPFRSKNTNMGCFGPKYPILDEKFIISMMIIFRSNIILISQPQLRIPHTPFIKGKHKSTISPNVFEQLSQDNFSILSWTISTCFCKIYFRPKYFK